MIVRVNSVDIEIEGTLARIELGDLESAKISVSIATANENALFSPEGANFHTARDVGKKLITMADAADKLHDMFCVRRVWNNERRREV